jgi:amidase
MSRLVWSSARSLARAIALRELSAAELMNASYDQIERWNPRLNAIVNLLPREEALRLARDADDALAAGAAPGPLHGLPMAPKDAVDARGFPTTMGFAPFAERRPAEDDALAARQREAGAIYIGKTNMPELGLGSHTVNALFGVTRNPYDPTRTAGGSSGGAAVALATGMLPLADGSDMGGSLRNPASYCNVVGFRPSIGRTPDRLVMGWFGRLATAGPMAREVADAALLLSVQAGPDRGDPLSLPEPGARFARDLGRDLRGLRIAWTPDLGIAPVEAQVAAAIERAAGTFEELGCEVAQEHPDLAAAMEVFQVQRAAALAVLGRAFEKLLPDWRDFAKDTAIWNVEKGLALSAEDLLRSELTRTRIHGEVARFFERHDALLLPAAQVPPFPVETEWVREINGVEMATYIDWMTICCAISVTGLPAISVPGGFTKSGLPVGVQIVGRPRGDFELLQIAHGFEQATRHHLRHPELVDASPRS